jgi:hypothetical protein
MALADAVQGARHVAQQITWVDSSGDAVDLTGATVTGKIRNGAGVVRDIDGTLTVTDDSGGVFTWAYGEDDVADDGGHEVQFIATYADTTQDKTFITSWLVREALDL